MRYVSQVLSLDGRRRVVCSLECRKTLLSRFQPAEPPKSTTLTMAILNQKGGTGKTTTSVSLAAGLAAKGYRTLLVDLDAQGNVGVSLGIRSTKSLSHVLVDGLPPEKAAVPVRSHLDVIVADQNLAEAEIEIAHATDKAFVLKRRMQSVVAPSSPYSFVILDCAPSLSLLNQNALVFARSVVVPVSCDYLSLVGVKLVLQTLEKVRKKFLTPVDIMGVVPTLYDRRNKISSESIAALEDRFGDRVLSPIRLDVRLKEAPSHKKPIFEYAPDSNAARDYEALVDHMIAQRVRRIAPREKMAVGAQPMMLVHQS